MRELVETVLRVAAAVVALALLEMRSNNISVQYRLNVYQVKSKCLIPCCGSYPSGNEEGGATPGICTGMTGGAEYIPIAIGWTMACGGIPAAGISGTLGILIPIRGTEAG